VEIGPIQMMVISFPESRFTGQLRAPAKELVERGLVRIVDALLVQKAADGSVQAIELDDADDEVQAMAGDLAEHLDLVSAEDADELGADLAPGASGLVLVLEHTWMKPFDDAITASGGTVIANVNVPKEVVDEVLAAVDEE
jgi:uncharacterized membrane protein